MIGHVEAAWERVRADDARRVARSRTQAVTVRRGCAAPPRVRSAERVPDVRDENIAKNANNTILEKNENCAIVAYT